MTKDIPENINLWVQKLRSGEYMQTKGTLKRKLSDGKVGYCCLGVYLETVEGIKVKTETQNSLSGGANKWYEVCKRKIPSKIKGDGITMNDRGKSFDEIADMIENYYKPNL